jgi:3,4-dihydroxy 2-butanone 4-phosphate synthase/GTP cyclohydrolase II
MHSSCFTGDLVASLRCDCGDQLHLALEAIAREGRGVLVYLPQEGRGIGLAQKIRAYALQDEGLDTVEANRHLGFKTDLRDYGTGAQILRLLEIRELKLLTNNPRKVVGLAGYGIKIVDRVPIEIPANPHNQRYLATKRDVLGHELSSPLPGKKK